MGTTRSGEQTQNATRVRTEPVWVYRSSTPNLTIFKHQITAIPRVKNKQFQTYIYFFAHAHAINYGLNPNAAEWGNFGCDFTQNQSFPFRTNTRFTQRHFRHFIMELTIVFK